jgi:putative transposase
MLMQFEVKWGQERPVDRTVLAAQLARITPLFDYPTEIRKVIYTANAIESINKPAKEIDDGAAELERSA